MTSICTVRSLLAAVLLLVPVSGALASTASAADATAAALGSRTLSVGSSGKDVSKLQSLLTKTGLPVARDGQFGNGTKNAVLTFQSVTGLDVTGVVDRATARALQAATASSGAVAAANNGGFTRASAARSSRVLGDRLPVRRGMSGRDVKMLQDFLHRAGVARVSIDGEFGRGTVRAMRTWERRVARSVDGIADAGDVAQLREEVDAVRGAVPAPVATTPVAATQAAPQLAPGQKATINADGTANAPASAPAAVKAFIAAANQIATKTYTYGGGHHADWRMDVGYDCSGSVSWGLHGAGLLSTPLPSGNFVSWGQPGPGQWITTYANGGHMYAIVAGLRFDTSGRSAHGTRWQTEMRDPSAFTARHPAGL